MMRDAKTLKPIGVAVYAALAMHANKNGTCFPSYDRLADLIGVCRLTIIRTIKTLVARGHVAVEKSGNRPNVYKLLGVTNQIPPGVTPELPQGNKLDTPGCLKRTLKGSYIHVAPFHLARYVDEQVFRFNQRLLDDAARFHAVMQMVIGRRLTYRQLAMVDGCGFMGIE